MLPFGHYLATALDGVIEMGAALAAWVIVLILGAVLGIASMELLRLIWRLL